MIHRLPSFWALMHAFSLRVPALVLPSFLRPMPAADGAVARRSVVLSTPLDLDSCRVAISYVPLVERRRPADLLKCQGGDGKSRGPLVS